VFEIVGLTLVEGGIYLLPDQLPVVGVHQLHQLIDGGFDLFRFVAVDAESIVGPEHFTSLYVPLPDAEVGYSLCLRQSGFALAQLFLRLFALGDIFHHAYGEGGLALGPLDAGDREPAPHDAAVFADVALLY
jgi:hypothetical protein